MSPRKARPSEGDILTHNGYAYEVQAIKDGKVTLARPDGSKPVEGYGATMVCHVNDVITNDDGDTFELAGRLPPDEPSDFGPGVPKAAAKKKRAR